MKLQDWLTKAFVRLQAEDGQTMAEYGLLVALIALAVILAVTLIGTNLSSIFNKIATDL